MTPWTIQSWSSPDQNTGVGSLFLLQGIFPTQGSNPGIKPRSPALQVDSLSATREAKEYWSGEPNRSPADLPDPGIEPGFPALQADSLLTELSEKTLKVYQYQ